MNRHLEAVCKDRDILLLMRFGSHLYGTDTPDSDEDFKGIFMPTKEEIFLNKIPKTVSYNSGNDKSKNTAEDVDIELYSLHYFLELAYKGETIAIDMLHVNEPNLIKTSRAWDFIHENRSRFYTNNLKGFVGYCREQAAKYGIKGSRISDARVVLNLLECCDPYGKMEWIWDGLPTGEHIHFVSHKTHGGAEEEFYQVCGKKMQKTAQIGYCIDILRKFIDSYGHWALLAEKNEGIAWKAVSHAIRYAFQISSIFSDGDIKFPLVQAEMIRDVKLGKRDYLTEVAPWLEALMGDIELLSELTNLPAQVDRKFWDKWLIEQIEVMI